jgi:hypothetical protein
MLTTVIVGDTLVSDPSMECTWAPWQHEAGAADAVGRHHWLLALPPTAGAPEPLHGGEGLACTKETGVPPLEQGINPS